MAKNFRQLLLQNAHQSMAKQQQLLSSILQEWKEKGKEKQTDDILVLGVRLS
jgi:acetate kinase